MWFISLKTTADSFLFNFTNGNNVSTAKLGYVYNQGKSVLCRSTYGPTIGKLHFHNNNWSYSVYNGGDQYLNIKIPINFTVEDYEVYQVIKK